MVEDKKELALRQEYFDYATKEFPYLNKTLIQNLFFQDSMKTIYYENKGIFCYCELKGFTGEREAVEMFFYIKPQYRNLKNLSRMLQHIENKLKEFDKIKIGANILYKDNKFIDFLKRKGYLVDTVYKQLKY